jgi:peptide deformylase
MPNQKIITLPDERLRQKSSRVHIITDETRSIVKDMVDFALKWEESRPHEVSAAMSAVQIGIMQKIVIVRNDLEDKNSKDFITLINPEIVKFEGSVYEDFEGCLSVADIYGKVPRYSKIRVKALDINGNDIRFKASDFLARVIQHEIDHTNGVVFIDHIKDQKDAFYQLDKDGELESIDYDSKIKNNRLLW